MILVILCSLYRFFSGDLSPVQQIALLLKGCGGDVTGRCRLHTASRVSSPYGL